MQGGTATDAAEPEKGSGEPVGGGAVMAAVHDTTGSPSRTVSAEGTTSTRKTTLKNPKTLVRICLFVLVGWCIVAVVLDSKIFVSLYIC